MKLNKRQQQESINGFIEAINNMNESVISKILADIYGPSDIAIGGSEPAKESQDDWEELE